MAPPPTTEEWTDLDFTFDTGVYSVTLKPGDEFYHDERAIILRFKSGESVTINRAKLCYYSERGRKVAVPAPKFQPSAEQAKERAV